MGRYTNYELITKTITNEEVVRTLPEDARELMHTGHCSRKWWSSFEEDMIKAAKSTAMGIVVKFNNDLYPVPSFGFFSSQGEVRYVNPSSEPGEGMTKITTPSGKKVYADEDFKIAFKLMSNQQIEELLELVPLKF